MFKILSIALIGALFTFNAFADTSEGKRAFQNQNYALALKKLLPAANKGDPAAWYILGKMHFAGLGVQKNPKKAVDHFKKAAELGNVDAQKEYGAALALGEGVEKNDEEGLKWLMIAVQQGHVGARAFAANYAKYFPRPVLSAARRAAFKWRQDFKKKSQ